MTRKYTATQIKKTLLRTSETKENWKISRAFWYKFWTELEKS